MPARSKKDFVARQEKLDAWRDIIRDEVKTLHPPPARLYSAKRAFSFPSVEAVALDGQPARLAADGLFASRLTLLGVSGSRFSEAMVESWLSDGPGLTWLPRVGGVCAGPLSGLPLHGSGRQAAAGTVGGVCCRAPSARRAPNVLPIPSPFQGRKLEGNNVVSPGEGAKRAT